MWISAVLAAAGGVIAWVTLGDRGVPHKHHLVHHHTHCALEAPPYADSRTPN